MIWLELGEITPKRPRAKHCDICLIFTASHFTQLKKPPQANKRITNLWVVYITLPLIIPMYEPANEDEKKVEREIMTM